MPPPLRVSNGLVVVNVGRLRQLGVALWGDPGSQKAVSRGALTLRLTRECPRTAQPLSQQTPLTKWLDTAQHLAASGSSGRLATVNGCGCLLH